MKFGYKQCGRIFVGKESDIQKVKDKIKEIDAFEYEYLPIDLITVWDGCLNRLEYVGKFDEIDIDNLCEEMQSQGVQCAWVSGSYGMLYIRRTLTKKQAKLMYDAGFMSKNDILKEYGIEFLGDFK